MAKNKVYYQGCISCGWRECFLMECTERDKCPQFKEYEKDKVKNFSGFETEKKEV